MKRLVQMVCVLLLACVVVVGQNQKTTSSDEVARGTAIKLFEGLTEEQKTLALLDVNDKDRYAEVFPASVRKGVPFDKLKAEQKALVEEAIAGLTSEFGLSRCLAVMKQTGPQRIYLTFYGKPEQDKPFAWRVASHHLTLLYAEFGKDKANEFGPILLGGNPAKNLWDDEEKLLLGLRAALSEEEAKKVLGKGVGASGSAIGMAGMKISELSDKPKVLAKKLLEQRLAVLSADRRKVLEALIQRDGGVEEMRLAISGNAAKGHLEGGSYNWKIGNATVLCDWQTVGKNHIHMTMRAKAKS